MPTVSPLTEAVSPSRRKPSSSRCFSSSSAVTRYGAQGGGGVLALAGAEAHPHLGGLQVAGGPVVEDRVADDVVAGPLGREVAALTPDDGGDLQLPEARLALVDEDVGHGRAGLGLDVAVGVAEAHPQGVGHRGAHRRLSRRRRPDQHQHRSGHRHVSASR